MPAAATTRPAASLPHLSRCRPSCSSRGVLFFACSPRAPCLRSIPLAFSARADPAVASELSTAPSPLAPRCMPCCRSVCSCCVRPLLGAACAVVRVWPARLEPKTCEALPLAPCACVCRRAASSPRLLRCRSTRTSTSRGVLFRWLALRADGLVSAGLVLRDSEQAPRAASSRSPAAGSVCMRCCRRAPRRLSAASPTPQALALTAWCPFFACPPRAPSDWRLLASRA